MNKNTISPQNRPTPWVVVYITHNLAEAQIIEGRLHHEGIISVLDYTAGMSAIGITIGKWGEVRILVHPADYDAAAEILYPELPSELEDSVDSIIYRMDDEDDK